MAAPDRPLAGMNVVVTRPAHQAGGLCTALESLGARVVRYPTLAISGPPDEAAARAALRALGETDLVIFVSVNAVHWALELLGGAGTVPLGTAIAAVGQGTARALEARGLEVQLRPESRFDSEGLLALEALSEPAVRGRRVLIVRGEGGRPLLGDTLRARGAEVACAEVYRRTRTALDPAPMMSAIAGGADHAVLVTSTEGLENLFAAVPHEARPLLQSAHYVVVSERVAEVARRLGVGPAPAVSHRADDASLVDAVRRLHQSRVGGR